MITIDEYDAYGFDLDGTIYIGDQLLPRVRETIEYIRSKGKKICFITNSSTLTREDCKERLEGHGIRVQLEEIVTALELTVHYFKEQCPLARVYVVADERVKIALHHAQIRTTEIPETATHVLVGHDRKFTYEKIKQAMDAILNGAQFIVINPDPVCPLPNGYIPDTMSFAKAIETASGRAIDQVIGKPSQYYGKKLVDMSGADKDRILIIGDRLDTDIMLGQSNGFSTCLVLTGVARKEDIRLWSKPPTYTIEQVAELFSIETSTI